MDTSIASMISDLQKVVSFSCKVSQILFVFLVFFLVTMCSFAFIQNLFTPLIVVEPTLCERIFFLSFGIFILYSLVFNYVMANRIGPGNPSDISRETLMNNQVFKKCRKCSSLKPIRTHHCSICNKCVLQMDHHCPWIGTCIEFELFLFALIVGILISLFSGFHWVILLFGRTTLELCEINDGYQPSKKFIQNFYIVFGTKNIILALLPIYTKFSYEGCEWDLQNYQELNQHDYEVNNEEISK